MENNTVKQGIKVISRLWAGFDLAWNPIYDIAVGEHMRDTQGTIL